MNRFSALLLVSWVWAGCQAPSGSSQSPAPSPPGVNQPAPSQPKPSHARVIPGGVHLLNTPVPVVLEIYGGFTSKELVIAPEVKSSTNKISLTADQLPKLELLQRLEKALLQQAGVRISQLDEQRLSVTGSTAPKNP